MASMRMPVSTAPHPERAPVGRAVEGRTQLMPPLLRRHLDLAGGGAAGGSERAQGEPGAEGGNVAARAVEAQPVVAERAVDRGVAEPDLGQHAQTGLDEEIDLE